MYKVIASFRPVKVHIDEHGDVLKRFEVTRDTETSDITVFADLLCGDGVPRTFSYSIAKFESAFKINLGKLL